MAWLAGWTYRKSVSLSRASGAVSNYQMKLLVGKNAADGADVHCNNHNRPDFSDLRFTKADGETLLDYFREEYILFSRYVSNPLTLPLQGANGVVHPDALYFDSAVDGYKYWMVYTPYPPDSKEAPCIVRSNDGMAWVETGITNPVIPLGGAGAWDEYHCPDPSMIYVSDYSKWFMAYTGSKPGAGKLPNQNSTTVGLAYSSDGKSWTKLGVLVDGTASYEKFSDTNERNCQQSSLTYEGGVFYLWYVTLAAGGTTPLGGNRGKLLLATFTWNDGGLVVENFTRDANNPISYPDQDGDFKNGLGHVSVSLHNGTYYMFCVREILMPNALFELALFTCIDKKSWVYQGKALARNPNQAWETTHIYKGSPLTDALKNIIVDANERFSFYYSGYASTGYPRIGLATSLRLATIWIEFDSIEPDATTFYMYYGKADAVTVSNGANTFITFDDFERGIDGDAVGGNWTGVVGAQIDTGQKWSGNRSCEIPRAAADGTMTIARVAETNTYSIRFRLRVAPIIDVSQKYIALHGDGSTRFTLSVKDSTEDIEYYTNAWQDSGADCTENTWVLIELNNYDFVANTTDLWVNNAKIVDNAAHQASAGNNGTIQFLNSHSAASGSIWIDDFIIRNWRIVEPAWGAWGTEEGGEPPVGGTSFVVWIN